MIEIPMVTGKTELKPFNQQQRIYLVGLVQSPGYQVLLDIMQAECVMQETKLLNTDATESKSVLVEHQKAQMMWQFFVGVQKKVQYEINEAVAPKMDPEVGDDEMGLSL